MALEGIDSDLAGVGQRQRSALRLVGFLFYQGYLALAYYVSLLPLALVVRRFWLAPSALLLLAVLVSVYVAGLIFLSFVVLTKRLVVGRLETDRTVSVQSPLGQRFVLASMLHNMVLNSPFRFVIASLSPLTPLYYRGMGAKLSSTAFLGNAHLFDPWFTEIHDNVTLGAGSFILGHIGNGPEVILGTVVLEDGAIIGVRSIIMPNVRVGRDARVGAGAVVVRGTVIPPGETWVGIPAKPLVAKAKSAGA